MIVTLQTHQLNAIEQVTECPIVFQECLVTAVDTLNLHSLYDHDDSRDYEHYCGQSNHDPAVQGYVLNDDHKVAIAPAAIVFILPKMKALSLLGHLLDHQALTSQGG
jgi:hypothetical protein